jgi:formyltetrahydrofolate synthetase
MFSFFNSQKEILRLKKENENIKHNANEIISSIIRQHQVDINYMYSHKIVIPKHIKMIVNDLYKTSTINYECSICMENIIDLCITDCGHFYCVDCIKQIQTCSICNSEFKKKLKY